ncbi:MAG: CBASS oligonucleotide cyclase [Salinivirgaceae bacterium]|nr:CBASS oligonucleotide cyclase [Salinivirgaceae bacterium]
MPTTIKQGFEKLRENLEITGLQEKTVSTRQQNVRDVVAAGMAVLDSFLTGSYRRSTMIAPLTEADVDVFVVLDPKHFSANGQRTLLDEVKRVLRKTYTRTPEISPNGQAVTIRFEDFKMDVVPGFYRKGGGFLIPDAQAARWISTDPKKHVELWTASNKAHNGDLVPLIKMIKGWNKTHSALFHSFHLECMIREILKNVTISDFSSGCRYVFNSAKDKVYTPIYDPAGYGGDVGSSMKLMDKQAAAGGLHSALNLALEAEQLESVGRTADAFEKWRKVFNDYFPAYG